MENQLRNAPFRTSTLEGTLARIGVVSLLVLLALPVFYLGLLGIYALVWLGDAISPSSVLLSALIILVPVFVVLSALGTLLSFRYVPMTVAALAIFYLGWAFTIYPFPGLLPTLPFYWYQVTMFAILCLNLAWIVWALRRGLALR